MYAVESYEESGDLLYRLVYYAPHYTISEGHRTAEEAWQDYEVREACCALPEQLALYEQEVDQ